MLGEAGGDSTVLFTVLRGQTFGPKPPAAPPMPAAPAMSAAPVIAPPGPTALMMPAFKLDPFELPEPLKPIKPFAVPVKLSFSFKWEQMPPMAPSILTLPTRDFDPFMARGAETVPLVSAAAMRRGARAGVLVVAINRASEADIAGLREGDVIEAVNGKLLDTSFDMGQLWDGPPRLSLRVVRQGRKLSISLPRKEKKQQ
jgi:hypothetical protein